MGDLTIETDEGLREFILPAPERAPRPRVVGPGRFERGYLERLSGLSAELENTRAREQRLSESLREGRAALELSQRVEHGCQRRIDRLEDSLEARTQALLESERQHKRLALVLGAMQRENELLRAQLPLALAEAKASALSSRAGERSVEPRPRAGLWQRIFGVRR